MITNKIVSKIAIMVMGEGENVSYEEKVLIALVAMNRYIATEMKLLKFNPLEKDFFGYRRQLKITNKLERKALQDSIEASIEAREIINHKESIIQLFGEFSWKYIYFFNKGKIKPSTKYKVEKCNLNIKTEHNFYKIADDEMVEILRNHLLHN